MLEPSIQIMSGIAPGIRRLKRNEYDTLVEIGAFEDEKIELIRGVLVEMSPVDPRHAANLQRFDERLKVALAGRATVRAQMPILACDESEPEPDLAVVPRGEYDDEHPSRASLIIEIAGSSLRMDREIKAPLYAASGFEEYWIVNLRDRVVEVDRHPRGVAWAEALHPGRDAVLSPLAFPDVKVELADLLR